MQYYNVIQKHVAQQQFFFKNVRFQLDGISDATKTVSISIN